MDHPARHSIVRELHSRPFPTIGANARVVFVALRPARRSERDREAERRQLARLLEHHSAEPLADGATQLLCRLGDWYLKWESHTEFESYLAWHQAGEGAGGCPLSADWLDEGPNRCIASLAVDIRQTSDEDEVVAVIETSFPHPERAVSTVMDGDMVIAGDFQLGDGGDMRFCVFPRQGVGERRIGRVVQRLCEIETYRALAMLGFVRSGELAPDLAACEAALTDVSGRMSAGTSPEETLDALLAVAGRLEALSARSEFRFSASQAYASLVASRVEVLRETRFHGRQTFQEFLTRRFDPAMRTTFSTKARLDGLTARAMRLGELLRTRVEVDRSAENRALLASMDRRSDLALKLQHTVEGLSVIAISYYGTGLALYVLAPLAEMWSLSKSLMGAIAAPVIVLATWAALRRLRNRMHP